MQWRLQLDIPITFPVEPGIQQVVHCRDFRPQADSEDNTFRDPVTGLVLLRPKFLSTGWYEDVLSLAMFQHRPNFWRETHRAGIPGLSSVRPQGTDFLLIELLINVALVAITASADGLVWALQSTYSLQPDEGWFLHSAPLTDEMTKARNWLYVQWDDIALRFSPQGVADVHQYDRARIQDAPKKVHTFVYCDPADLFSKHTWLAFLPVPTLGLLVYHSTSQPALAVRSGNAEVLAGRGHLIPWKSRQAQQGWTLFDPSPIRVAVNPYLKYQMTFGLIRYPVSGSYTDAPLDLSMRPSSAPVVAPILLPSRGSHDGASCDLRQGDNSGPWTSGSSARVRTTLTTNNPSRSPFLYGYGLARDPVFATRITTPITPRMTRLEWFDSSSGETEGEAELLVEGDDATRIAERGDAPFVLERSEDGTTWHPHLMGIATEWRLTLEANTNRWWYRAACRLTGMSELLREKHLVNRTAMDNLTVAEALNVCMRVGGFPPVADMPPALTQLRIPLAPGGDHWRFAPTEGDDVWTVLQKLLLHARGQYRDYRLEFDPAAQVWKCVLRPRDTTTIWTLVPRLSEDLAQRRVAYQSCQIQITPPEANVLILAGATVPGQHGVQIRNSIRNFGSLFDANSPHYLGRVKAGLYTSKELTSAGEVNKMLRRLGEVMLYRRAVATVQYPRYVDGLRCDVAVHLNDMQGQTRIGQPFWIKRRSVVVTPGYKGYQETTTLELDTIWETDIT